MNISTKNTVAVLISIGFLVAFVVAMIQSSKSSKSSESKSGGQGTLNHVASFDEALAQAKKENKTVAIDFKAEWCGPCKSMQSEAFVDGGVAELMKDTLFVSVDVDEPGVNSAVLNKYSPEGLPTVLFLDANGKEIGRTVGYGGVEMFKSEIRRILKKS